MKKAVLVVEMPDNCLRCQFCNRDTHYPTCKIDRLIGGSYNTTWEKLDTIPEWCPLVTIPDAKQDCHDLYNDGWNAVLSLLLTKKGER